MCQVEFKESRKGDIGIFFFGFFSQRSQGFFLWKKLSEVVAENSRYFFFSIFYINDCIKFINGVYRYLGRGDEMF